MQNLDRCQKELQIKIRNQLGAVCIGAVQIEPFPMNFPNREPVVVVVANKCTELPESYQNVFGAPLTSG